MVIQAELSIFPLGQPDLAPGIYQFLRKLERPGLELVIGPTSTVVYGPSALVFTGMQEAFEVVSEEVKSILIVKISSAPTH